MEYLIEIETQQMWLEEGRDTRKRAEAVVGAILEDETIWTWPDNLGRFA